MRTQAEQEEAGEEAAPAADEGSEDEDEFIYNPLKLPLGWDGKPIPYWLYKLHGLNQEFKCEICGNFSYWGRWDAVRAGQGQGQGQGQSWVHAQPDALGSSSACRMCKWFCASMCACMFFNMCVLTCTHALRGGREAKEQQDSFMWAVCGCTAVWCGCHVMGM